MGRRSFWMFYSAVLVFFVLLSSGCQRTCSRAGLEGDLPTMNVRGEGKVEAVPDEAVIKFGVDSDEKTLSKAYSDNSVKMNNVIELLKKMGVEKKDIATSSYNIFPVYPKDDSGRQIPGKPVSFRVRQELTVNVREVGRAGEVIDKVVAFGVNTFSGIQFISGKIDELEAEARVKAAKDAGKKAAALAEALNVKLGRILRVNQSSDRPYPVSKMLAYDTSSVRSAPQIEPGSMEVTAVCDVVYEIVQ
jgi:uncharacterized protein